MWNELIIVILLFITADVIPVSIIASWVGVLNCCLSVLLLLHCCLLPCSPHAYRLFNRIVIAAHEMENTNPSLMSTAMADFRPIRARTD